MVGTGWNNSRLDTVAYGPVEAELFSGVRLGYRPELDGLRAFAVTAVIFFHYFEERYIEGGFLGVDLFFVLSGFLITRLLLEERARTGRIDLPAFYVRRAARLFPAVLLLGAVCIIDAFTVGFLGGAAKTLFGVAGMFGYFTNWARALGYDTALGHTWSLSIEEQFYILWPAFLIVIYRRGTLRTVKLAALAVVAVAAIETSIRSFLGVSPGVLYNSTDSHGGIMLMAGCLLATVLPVGGIAAAHWLSGVTRRTVGVVLAVIAALVAWSSPLSQVYWRGAFLGVAALFMLLICQAMRPGMLRSVLRVGAITWVGRISYGLYLWHYPIWFAIREQLPEWSNGTIIVVSTVLTVAAATASFYAVELPIKTAVSRHRRARPRATSAATTSAVV